MHVLQLVQLRIDFGWLYIVARLFNKEPGVLLFLIYFLFEIIIIIQVPMHLQQQF